jgi:hypothetical protein
MSTHYCAGEQVGADSPRLGNWRQSVIVSKSCLERRFLMEPRKEMLKKSQQPRNDERKSRFRIVKLEERIAPCNAHYNPKGKLAGLGNCSYGYGP